MARVLRLFLGGLVSLVFVSGIILSSFSVSADEQVKVSNVDIAVPASCEMSGAGTNSHTADINNGTYMENIGKTTLTVFCNDGGGYAIYAVGYTGEEIGGTNSTKLVGEDYSLTIDTGVYAQGTTTSSVWAMKLTKVTNTSTSYLPANLTIENGFDSYHVVPAAYTKVASFTSTTDLTLGSKLETTYAAYISGTQRADIYNGKVKYTLVHPSNADAPNYARDCTAGKICYWPNSSTTTDSMGDQTVSSSATEVTLWASNFKKQGYGFAGWSTTFDYSDSNGFLGPNEVIDDATILATIQSEGLSLYAYWIPSNGNLQGWTGCNAMNIGDVTALTDTRDNDTYAVAKLADNKCWMIENLRLDYDAAHNTDGTLAQGYGGQFAGLAAPETANFQSNTGANDATTANSLYYAGAQTGTASINIIQENYAGYRMPRYRNDNTNSNSIINPNITEPNMTGPNQNIYSYGNYYTWAAALANTYSYGSSTSKDPNGNTSSGAGTSLCPTGWKLPIGTSSGDFQFLSNSLSGVSTDAERSKAFRVYPMNFVFSSNTTGNQLNSRGIDGQYWSSTSGGDAGYSRAYILYITNSFVGPGTFNTSKYGGLAIRCLFVGG